MIILELIKGGAIYKEYFNTRLIVQQIKLEN